MEGVRVLESRPPLPGGNQDPPLRGGLLPKVHYHADRASDIDGAAPGLRFRAGKRGTAWPGGQGGCMLEKGPFDDPFPWPHVCSTRHSFIPVTAPRWCWSQPAPSSWACPTPISWPTSTR